MNELDIDEQVSEDAYPAYLRQKSLNAALIKSTVFAGVWVVLGALTLAIAALVRPDADVVGMDQAGREHTLQVIKAQNQVVGKTS